MGEFFNPEKGIWVWLSTLVDIVGLSIFWAVLCLPAVTIGPATAALYYTVVKCVRGRESGAFGYYLRSFRQNFKTGFPAGLIALAVSAALLYGGSNCTRYMWVADPSGSFSPLLVTLSVAIPLALSKAYSIVGVPEHSLNVAAKALLRLHRRQAAA